MVEVVLAPANAMVPVAPVVDGQLIAVEGAGGYSVQLRRKVVLVFARASLIWDPTTNGK